MSREVGVIMVIVVYCVPMAIHNKNVIEACAQVSARNASTGYTVPSTDLYPHQWLWDSCFTAIGLRHLDTKRAQQELLSLKKGHGPTVCSQILFSKNKFLNFRSSCLGEQTSLRSSQRRKYYGYHSAAYACGCSRKSRPENV